MTQISSSQSLPQITPPAFRKPLVKTPWWENPTVLFILMGVLTAAAMIGTYVITLHYTDPLIVIIAISVVAGLMILIGGLIIHTIQKVTEVSRLKTEFISVASHQLRTPLSGIRWYLELLLEKSRQEEQSEEVKEYITTLLQTNQRMIKLVNSLLDVSRIEQGRLKIEPQKIPFQQLYQEIIKIHQQEAKAKGIHLITGPIPPDVYIFGDPRLLEQVLENLISNSIKYTPSGGTVKIDFVLKKSNIQTCVADTGVGIPPAEQKRIFQRFFRANNVLKMQSTGTGLGLYIAKAIVEAHKGKIWFKSKEGQGTVFYFTLPLAKQDKSDTPQPTPRHH